jgi:hypothetical protein
VNKDRDEPTIEQLAEWTDGGVTEAVDGREGIAPDGYCPHGSRAGLLKLGYI